MRRPGPKEWKRLVEEYGQSELTQKEYCAKHDVALSSFQYWRYKQGKLASRIDVNARGAFLPVEVVASPAPRAREQGRIVEVSLRSGVTVRFAVGTDTMYLAQLLAAVG